MSEFVTVERGNIVINTVPAGGSLEEILAFGRANLPRWVDRDVIWEVSQANFAGLDNAALTRFVASSAESSRVRSGRKTAIVAAPDLNYGMMRMFAMLAGGRLHIELAVFRDLDAALAWLQE